LLLLLLLHGLLSALQAHTMHVHGLHAFAPKGGSLVACRKACHVAR
jgi:hypothetical protein